MVERLTVDQLVTSSILVDRTSSVADRKGRMTVYFNFVAQHHWCSGIMGRCHRLDPGSIPGWCSVVLADSIVVSIPVCHTGDPGSIPGRGMSAIISCRIHPIPSRTRKLNGIERG